MRKEATVTAEISEAASDVPRLDPAVTAAADDAKAAPRPETSPRPRRAVRAAAAGICIAAVVALGYLGWQYQQQRAIASASSAALAAARSYAEALTSIDSTSVDDNFATVIDGATGQFKDMYTQSATQLRQVLIDNKAMSKGVVLDAAVKSASKNSVEILLFVDQAITNVASPSARIDRSRVDVTMERVDGRWLASHVELK